MPVFTTPDVRLFDLFAQGKRLSPRQAKPTYNVSFDRVTEKLTADCSVAT